jgi:hypothetical protein
MVLDTSNPECKRAAYLRARFEVAREDAKGVVMRRRLR